MGTKQPKADKAVSSIDSEAVVSVGGPTVVWWSQRRNQLKIAAALAVFIIASVGLYALLRPDHVTPPPKVDISQLDGDYSVMTRAQVDYFLYKKTGLTLEYLAQKDVSKRVLKNFSNSRQAAEALGAVGMRAKSQQAYAIAAAQAPKTADYQFYLDYAVIARSNEDMKTWKTQMLSAQQAAQKQNDADTATRIKSQIRRVEAGI